MLQTFCILLSSCRHDSYRCQSWILGGDSQTHRCSFWNQFLHSLSKVTAQGPVIPQLQAHFRVWSCTPHVTAQLSHGRHYHTSGPSTGQCIKTDGSGPRLFYAWRVTGPWDVPLSVRWQSPALWLYLGYDKALECDTVLEGEPALWGMVSMSSGLWQVLTVTSCRLYFCLGFTGHQMP